MTLAVLDQLARRASICHARPFTSVPPAVRTSRFFVPKRKFPVCVGSSMSMPGDEAAAASDEKEYKPFKRLGERDSYRLLGIGKDASFEEVRDAKDFLIQEYKWHEPSRESIELAYDRIVQDKLIDRNKFGFRPYRIGQATVSIPSARTLLGRVSDFFDPTVTPMTLVNEGGIFVALAAWALCTSDQSFSLAATFAYSVYKFQSKRLKMSPDGPFLGGNAMVGALLSTLLGLAVSCGIMAVVTTYLSTIFEFQTRKVGACMVVLMIGTLNTVLK